MRKLLLTLLVLSLLCGVALAESAPGYPGNAVVVCPEGSSVSVMLPEGWTRVEDSPFFEYISAERDVSVAFRDTGNPAADEFAALQASFDAGEVNTRELTRTLVNGRECLLYIDENDQRCARLCLDNDNGLYVSCSEIGDEGAFLRAVLESVAPAPDVTVEPFIPFIRGDDGEFITPTPEPTATPGPTPEPTPEPVYRCSICKDTGVCSQCGGVTTPCSKCNGKGYVNCFLCDGSGSCGTCHGLGWLPNTRPARGGSLRKDCYTCNGTGDCNYCDGTGHEECYRCGGSGKDECFSCNGTGRCPYCQ